MMREMLRKQNSHVPKEAADRTSIDYRKSYVQTKLLSVSRKMMDQKPSRLQGTEQRKDHP